VRPAGAAANDDDLTVAAWIVPVMNNGVPHVICLLRIITIVMDVVLPWKGMRRSVHFQVSRREAIFNRYTHESILREFLRNICLHPAGTEAAPMNHDRYAMSFAVVNVEYGRSNTHAINHLVGLNKAQWRRSGSNCSWPEAIHHLSSSGQYPDGESGQQAN
jgi:hypothetical protein